MVITNLIKLNSIKYSDSYLSHLSTRYFIVLGKKICGKREMDNYSQMLKPFNTIFRKISLTQIDQIVMLMILGRYFSIVKVLIVRIILTLLHT
jgi:hypothetical protein